MILDVYNLQCVLIIFLENSLFGIYEVYRDSAFTQKILKRSFVIKDYYYF